MTKILGSLVLASWLLILASSVLILLRLLILQRLHWIHLSSSIGLRRDHRDGKGDSSNGQQQEINPRWPFLHGKLLQPALHKIKTQRKRHHHSDDRDDQKFLVEHPGNTPARR